jgi:hypothetical protein
MLINGKVRDLACSKAAGRDRQLGVNSSGSIELAARGQNPPFGV